MDLEREQDIEHLRNVALTLEASNRQLVKVLEEKCKELEELKGSENELQATLNLIEQLTAKERRQDKAAPLPTRKQRKARARSGPTPQPNLPIIEETFELDEADKVCPSCGGELVAMAGQFETSEMVDVVEVKYRVVRAKRQKYVCSCGSCVDTALGPDKVVTGGRYSLGFAAKVAIDKYLDHLPLERQVRILERHGVNIGSQTLWDQVHYLSERLALVDDALIAHVLAQPVIGLDQTSWKRLGAGHKARPWQIWSFTSPGFVVHRIRDDKSAKTFKELLQSYRGVVVCDALSTHQAGARDGPGIILAHCWAHVFRRFEEALPDHPGAEVPMRLIRQLYDIDESASSDLEALATLRRTESTRVLVELREWLWNHASLKTLSIGKAAAYAIRIWDGLTRFTQDPRIPLDNNATERGIRGPVVGRKNHYGSKSERGTVVASRLYSILETVKLHDVNPADYLVAAIRAADDGKVLLPQDYARS